MGGGGGGMADIFDMFGGGGPRRRQEVKGEDIHHKLQVKLEDLYKGSTRCVCSVVEDLFARSFAQYLWDLCVCCIGRGRLRDPSRNPQN